MAELNVSLHYPNDPNYDFETKLVRLNLDKEREHDLATGNGFIVSSPKAVKDDIKDPNGIYSSRFGQTLQDINPFANRYKCKCGFYDSKLYNGIVCPKCGEPVRYVDDQFGYFGYITLKDPYHIIHPNLFKTLSYFIGSTAFNNIINPVNKKDEDGLEIENIKKPKDEPYYGLGMLDFYDKFDEILEYYKSRYYNTKRDYYDDIIANRDNIFIQSIPVYTTHLRPFKIDGRNLNYEGTNALYNIMARLAANINQDSLKIFRKKKPKNELLYNLQSKYNELYDEIVKIISGKKGTVRSVFGGRFNFTSRSVITPGPDLKIDEIRLSYQSLVGLLQQVIINILHKTYSIGYDDAYKMLVTDSLVQENPLVRNIILGIIKDSPRGIPIIINRNPTISYGGILQCYCIGISTGYTMNISLQVIKGLGADFDGDTLNILYIINQDFLNISETVFNPRNMYISKNDGYFSNDYSQQRDTLINVNTLLQLSRSNYTQDDLRIFDSIKNML